MLKVISLLMLVCFANGVLAKSELSIKNSNKHLKTQYLSMLDTAKVIKNKLEKNLEFDAELKKLKNLQESFDKKKLLTVMVLAKKYAQLKEKGANDKILEQMSIRRRQTVLRFNELSRLLIQIEKNSQTALLKENINALIEFFEPSDNISQKDLSKLKRRAVKKEN
ncbi:hypothetical protein AAEX28_15220 [Lentisphaerota bacterium WC36G]|nr:hypothetical protein LJT99_01990 [Lentisphaerae bacterium WC36]